MYLSQSVVLWQGRGGIHNIALFGQIQSPYYGKTSSNKQREITVHHYLKTWIRKMSRTLKVSSVAVAKTIKNYDETDSWGLLQERMTQKWPLLQGISSLEIPASESSAQINYLQSSSNRHININCSVETAWIRPAWWNCCKETPTKAHQ